LRTKAQIIGIAAIFMVLLYNSPAGLVLYWTTSQVFSLCKNIAMKTDVLRKKEAVLLLCFGVIILSVIGMVTRVLDTPSEEYTAEALLILAVVQLVKISLELKNENPPYILTALKRYDKYLPNGRFRDLIAVNACFVLLYGICIPSSVLSSSAREFVDSSSGRFLTELLTYPAMIYTGFFMVWISVFYLFSGRRGRRTLFSILIILLSVSLLNYFTFDIKPNFYYADLSFDGALNTPISSAVINLVLSAVVGFLGLAAWKKKTKTAGSVAGVVAMALLLLGGYNIAQISTTLAGPSPKAADEQTMIESGGILPLSKTANNVIVFMLDRALGAYVPYIIEEKPELKEAFDGFVFYPNTASNGSLTIYGAPPLYGGYEYTPDAIIKNSDKSVEQMRKEALKVLPVLFSENEFRTTVTDPALFDVSLYHDYSGITAINLVGQFNDTYVNLFKDSIRPIQRRNFVVFSIYRTVPLLFRKYVYSNGSYLNVNNLRDAYTQAFIDNYAALSALPSVMACDESDQGSFLFLQNATPHEPTVLKAPDYTVEPGEGSYEIPYGERTVNGRTLKIEELFCWKQYSVTMATFRKLVEWIDRLKELGIYDNTRIILVADHGIAFSPPQFPDLVLPEGSGIESCNPLLMVKDFNSRGEMSVNMEFMTNADVPAIATKDVIQNPINPFTGNELSGDKKQDGVLIMGGVARRTDNVDAMQSMSDYKWWRVKDNIFDLNCWEMITGEESE
jgi:hypothetical protein